MGGEEAQVGGDLGLIRGARRCLRGRGAALVAGRVATRLSRSQPADRLYAVLRMRDPPLSARAAAVVSTGTICVVTLMPSAASSLPIVATVRLHSPASTRRERRIPHSQDRIE